MNDEKNIDIIFVGDNNHSTVGGDQESTKVLLNSLNDIYKLAVIQPGQLKNKVNNVIYYELSNETRIKHLVKKPLSFFLYICSVIKIIRKSKPKVIHTQSQVSFFIVSFLKKIEFIHREIILIHTERSLYIKYNFLFRKIFFCSMKELNTLVTTTKLNMKDWKNALDEKGININYEVIENTAGEIFEKIDKSKLKQSDDTINISFAGRYNDVKNWPLALEISERLEHLLKDRLIVNMAVGCLDEKSENETIKMFNYMESLLGERFVGKINIDINEMDDIFYQTDVFILTSKENSESFGRTLVEAMSRYTAVLTTNAGGPEEVIKNPNNVLRSAEEFAARVVNYYEDNNLLTKEKELNFDLYKKNYSLENNVSKHIRLYTKLF